MNLEPTRHAPRATLFARYAAGDDALSARLGGPPTSRQAWTSAVERARAVRHDRPRLVECLLRFHAEIGGSAAAERNIHSLADPDTFVVATGQQPGLLGGPLYTLHKVVGVVALARELTRALGVRFVPLFWIASDDHDLAEIEGCYVLDDQAEVRRLRLELQPVGAPSSHVRVPAEAEPLVAGLFETLPATPARDRVRDLVAPRPGERWPIWFARIVDRLFSESGVMLFEPHAARDLIEPVLRRELERPERIPGALAAGARALAAAGLEAPLAPDAPSSLFALRDGRRVRLDPRDGGVPDLLRDFERDPSLVTADAGLRPIVQSLCLPAPFVAGGPGELAYWLQLAEAFDVAGAPRPVFVPRFSATFVEPRTRRAMEQLGISKEVAFAGEEAVRARVELAAGPPSRELRTLADAALAAVERFADAVPPAARGGAKTAEQWRATYRESVERILRRVEDAERERAGVSRRRADWVARSFMPRGRMQERVLNAVPFLARHGVDLFERLAARIDPLCHDHVLVHLSGTEGSDD